MRIVIAPDSFKGCLTSEEAAEAIAEGLRSRYPDAEMLLFPMADGGEGTARVLAGALGASAVEADTLDPLLNPHRACYYLKGDTAYIDIASASGLALLSPGERNPLRSSSYGSGLLIADALRHGARRIVAGLGGSATVDCGAPLLQALGVRFFDARGREFKEPLRGSDLMNISALDTFPAEPFLSGCEITLLCDVQTPLLDTPRAPGAVEVFGKQKGLPEDAQDAYKAAVSRFAHLLEGMVGRVSEKPMTGAAGGISAGLSILPRTKLLPGAPYIIETTGLRAALAGAGLLITGEGSSDAQTLLGKLPAALLKAAQKNRKSVPTILLAGRIEEKEALLRAGFVRLIDINAPYPPGSNPLDPGIAAGRLRRAAETIELAL